MLKTGIDAIKVELFNIIYQNKSYFEKRIYEQTRPCTFYGHILRHYKKR